MARRYDVVFTTSYGTDFHAYAIREVDSQQIGHYVTIKGIITRVGEMLPLVRIAAYECRECHQECFQRVSFTHSPTIRSFVVPSHHLPPVPAMSANAIIPAGI